ncbi:hypothetical protein B0T19DRAFT_415269, partial [Cercophora scortea]
MPSHISPLVLAAAALLLLAAGRVQARTDLAGCVSTETIIQTQGGGQGYASLIWYDPGTGEICSFIDCGGGRAAPKTTVPGCVGYQGTETVTPSYLSGFGATATLDAGESSGTGGTVVATAGESATGVVESVTSVFGSSLSASGMGSSLEAVSTTAPAGLEVSSSSSSSSSSLSGVELTTSSGTVTKGSSVAGGGAQSTSTSGLGSGGSTRTSTAGAAGATQTGVVRHVVGLAAAVAARLAFVCSVDAVPCPNNNAFAL